MILGGVAGPPPPSSPHAAVRVEAMAPSSFLFRASAQHCTHPEGLRCLACSGSHGPHTGPSAQPPTMADEIAGTEREAPGQGTEGTWDFAQTRNSTQAARRTPAWPAVPRIGSEDKETVGTMSLSKGSLGCVLSPAWLQRMDALCCSHSSPVVLPCPSRQAAPLSLREDGEGAVKTGRGM